VSKAGINLVANLSGVGALTVNGVSGDDTLTVQGTTAPDAFTISPTAVLLSTLQGVDMLSNIDALTVYGDAGADTFSVTPGAIPIRVVGDAPLGGATGDSLLLNVTTAVTFHLGLQAGAGRFDVAAAQPVTFEQMEQLAVDGDGNDGVTVNGTPGADAFALTALLAPDDFTVSLNGATVTYTDFASATLEGFDGDDAFTVAPLAGFTTDVIIHGGNQTAGGDTLHV